MALPPIPPFPEIRNHRLSIELRRIWKNNFGIIGGSGKSRLQCQHRIQSAEEKMRPVKLITTKERQQSLLTGRICCRFSRRGRCSAHVPAVFLQHRDGRTNLKRARGTCNRGAAARASRSVTMFSLVRRPGSSVPFSGRRKRDGRGWLPDKKKLCTPPHIFLNMEAPRMTHGERNRATAT